MEKKEKKKGFNVIDIIVIAVVLIVIAAAMFIFVIPKATDSSKDESDKYLELTVELTTIKEKFKDCVKVGDPVMETIGNNYLGQVVDVYYEPATIATTDLSDGSMKMSSYPDYQRAVVTIRAPYTTSEFDQYVSAEMVIAVGVLVNFSTPDFISYGYCTDMRVLTEEENIEWAKELKEAELAKKGKVTKNDSGK